MGNLLQQFPWPPLPGNPAPPVWDGNQFLINGEQREMLCYEFAESHWTSELTELHEAEAGSHHPIDRASRILAIQSFQRFLPQRNVVVLDVGCSSGFLLQEIRHCLPEIELIGSDFIFAPLQARARPLRGVPLLQFDLRKCPLPDACIDGVTALNVLEHIDDDQAALRHLWRILKPGGVAHIEVPAGPHLYDIYDEHLMHHRRYTLAGLRQLALDTHFMVLKATHLGTSVYPAFAWVKRRNRRLLSRPRDEKRALVAGQIRTTSQSKALRLLLATEMILGNWLRYPCGIRCVIILRKPETASSR
jgi:SAM-dependent methyltransferase